MKRYKNLLVHLDLEGTHDQAAIRYAAAVSQLGRSSRAEFVHTGPVTTLLGGWLEDSSDRMAAWLGQANADLDNLVRRHFRGPRGCRVRIQVLGGAGFHDLLDQLRHGDTDLIVVGKSETNVAFVEKLVRKAPCSVLVVPPCRSVAYRRIMVTTDLSHYSASAMEVALAFARARKLKHLTCFHGYQIPYGIHKTGIPREEFQKETEAWVMKRFQDFAQNLNCGNTELRTITQESQLVAPAILAQATRQKSDLLVMGARGKDALAAALLGSTTAEVVRETRIPTLVVKAKGAGQTILDLLLGSEEESN